MVGAKCKVSFDISKSITCVLGFTKPNTYGVGCRVSENLVNIMSVNSILVHCNIIQFSYMCGTQAPVAYTCSWTKDIRSTTQFNIVTVDVISTLLQSRAIEVVLDQQEYRKRMVMLAHVDLLAREVKKVHEDLSVLKVYKVYKVFKDLKAIVVNEVNVARKEKRAFKVKIQMFWMYWLNEHLPIQVVTKSSCIVELVGGVETLRCVSAYHGSVWHFDAMLST